MNERNGPDMAVAFFRGDRETARRRFVNNIYHRLRHYWFWGSDTIFMDSITRDGHTSTRRDVVTSGIYWIGFLNISIRFMSASETKPCVCCVVPSCCPSLEILTFFFRYVSFRLRCLTAQGLLGSRPGAIELHGGIQVRQAR